jgi:hypothetical protein
MMERRRWRVKLAAGALASALLGVLGACGMILGIEELPVGSGGASSHAGSGGSHHDASATDAADGGDAGQQDADAGACDAAADHFTGACKALATVCSVNLQDCCGAPCDVECLFGVCELHNGVACDADVQCMTHLCSNAKCLPCNVSSDCHGTTCVTMFGTCLLPTGAACGLSGQCESNACSGSPPTCQ